MKFSIIFEAQMVDPSPESERQVFQDCVEQAVFAEKVGFDGLWAVEHHCLKQYAHMSAPETFLAFVAGKTSRIRIGHGVVCLPFKMNHPIKVAERVATLDILSQGRVDFGVGKGGTETEAGAFDVHMPDIDAQLEESFRMIPEMWDSDVYSHESELIRVPERSIHPKPWQSPHPPLFMACTRKETLNPSGGMGRGCSVSRLCGPTGHRKEESGLPRSHQAAHTDKPGGSSRQ